MKRKVIAGILILSMMAGSMTGCGTNGKKVKLDPNNPVSITVWHYYNGRQQATFDELVDEFNSTVGDDEGIYIESYSQGSVSDLEKAITNSLSGNVGAEKLPDVFSSYADTAYAVQKQGKLVDLTNYFTEKEIDQYVDSYVEEGYLNGDDALYLIPTAKSTETLMVDKTDWDPFAQETGASLDDLNTTEGITEVAEKYYEWTDNQTPDIPNDGKAFYGRDSMSNYFVIGMKQMGKDIFEVKDGNITVNTDKELIHRLWENYYVPYMKGYFAAYGKFRSDDVKTGNIIAYTGSTSSASYFPDQVENEEGTHPITYIIHQAPVMEGGENYRVQQGAGMAVTKSDEQHEYAASVFLKWFTQKDQNLRFVCESSYMPVMKESNSMDAVDEVVKDKQIEMNDKTYECMEAVLNQFDEIKFYTPKTCEEGFDMRKVLDYNLSDRAAKDRETMNAAVAAGASREEELAKYTSEESFENWYSAFCDALNQAKGN